MTAHRFPPTGFLVLGVLSIAASVVFLVRAAGIEATTERILSAVVFGVMGVIFLAAYSASQHTSSH
jgi:uncharacterized membrane protein HdeD (DUF308 family)